MTLPLFEDQPVDRAAVRITRAGDGLSEALKIQPRALHIGDQVYYLLCGTCTQVNHREKDDEITRLQTIEAERITEVDGELAEKILAEAADALEHARADATGQLAIDDDE